MNMDYCKWENTYHDIVQCLTSSTDALSESEEKYARKTILFVLETLYELDVISDYDTDELDLIFS